MTTNIIKLLGDIALDKELSLTEVCSKYYDFYSTHMDKEVDHLTPIEYSKDIYQLTHKHYYSSQQKGN